MSSSKKVKLAHWNSSNNFKTKFVGNSKWMFNGWVNANMHYIWMKTWILSCEHFLSTHNVEYIPSIPRNYYRISFNALNGKSVTSDELYRQY